jgi:hypothetical protein
MASHTTTGEWKSFELRMRLRRAERLVIRAQMAADAGYAEDARLSLAEARQLAPGLAGIEAVEETLDRLAAPPADAPTRRRWRGAAIVAATLAAVAFAVSPRPRPIVPSHSLQTLLLEPPAVTAPPVEPISPAPALGLAQPHPQQPPVPSATHKSGAAEDDAPAPPIARPAMSGGMPAVAPLVRERIDPPPRPTPPPAPERHAAEATAPIPAIGDVVAVAVAVEALPASSVPSPSLPAPAPPAPPTRTFPTDAAVRTALDRYAAAYSALDADAAERVWPGVNHAALTRAFDGLVSQRISLGNCRIDVSGATARASCAGSATWTPKIGGGAPHTEARLWTFDLARAGADWRIVNARVQNR